MSETSYLTIKKTFFSQEFKNIICLNIRKFISSYTVCNRKLFVGTNPIFYGIYAEINYFSVWAIFSFRHLGLYRLFKHTVSLLWYSFLSWCTVCTMKTRKFAYYSPKANRINQQRYKSHFVFSNMTHINFYYALLCVVRAHLCALRPHICETKLCNFYRQNVFLN